MDGLVNWFVENLQGISGEWVSFIVSLLPILEVRGGLLVARAMGVPLITAAPLCVLGNVIPIPFILWLITPVFNWLKRTRLFRPLVEKIEARAMSKRDRLDRGVFWGLLLFVGIPLPGTGAWTGALLAALLNVPPKKALPAILLGVLLATVIMTVIAYVLPDVFLTLFA